MPNSEIFEIFDANNQLIGQAPRDQVHAEVLFHRSVHVLLFNSQNEILLQRRAANKDICPNLWDLSAAEHLKPGETTHQAALRGLEEELGIPQDAAPNLTLTRAFRLQRLDDPALGIRDYEFVETYTTTWDGPLIMDTVELADMSFWSKEKLQTTMQKEPGLFTPWFQNEMAFLGFQD